MPCQTSRPFSTQEQAALGALVGWIIPASEAYGQPGADDPVILEDILATGAPLHATLSPALAWLASRQVDRAAVAAFRRLFAQEADVIATLAVQCYYRDDRVMRAIGIDISPPFPGGYTQMPNDHSLLNPVRLRGEIYRKVS